MLQPWMRRLTSCSAALSPATASQRIHPRSSHASAAMPRKRKADAIESAQAAQSSSSTRSRGKKKKRTEEPSAPAPPSTDERKVVDEQKDAANHAQQQRAVVGAEEAADSTMDTEEEHKTGAVAARDGGNERKRGSSERGRSSQRRRRRITESDEEAEQSEQQPAEEEADEEAEEKLEAAADGGDGDEAGVPVQVTLRERRGQRPAPDHHAAHQDSQQPALPPFVQAAEDEAVAEVPPAAPSKPPADLSAHRNKSNRCSCVVVVSHNLFCLCLPHVSAQRISCSRWRA